MFRRSMWACALWAAIPGLSAPAGAVDVTACGQTVGRGEIGVLLNDLDCSTPSPGPAAVTLQNRATLQMNGHRVTFTPPAPETYGIGIECAERGRCLIQGPGELTGELVGVVARESKVTISDVVFHDIISGIRAAPLSGESGPPAGNDVDATNVTVVDAEAGIRGRSLRANGVSVTRITGLAAGISLARKIRGTDVTASQNAGGGVFCGSGFDLDGFVATQNSGDGGLYTLHGGRLRNATVTGNTVTISSDVRPIDIFAGRRPVVENVTCDHSLWRSPNGIEHGPFGFCAGD